MFDWLRSFRPQGSAVPSRRKKPRYRPGRGRSALSLAAAVEKLEDRIMLSGNPFIAGDYQDENGLPTQIEQNGNALAITTAQGNTFGGTFVTPTRIVPTNSGALSAGTLTSQGIAWDDGSAWSVVALDAAAVAGNYDANGLATSVQASGLTLTFTDPFGNSSTGRYLSHDLVEASDWGGLTATVDNAGNLNWGDGSVWTATGTGSFPNIAGSYLTGGLSTSIEQFGQNLTFNDPFGNSSSGRFLSANQVEATNWGGLTATIDANGNLTWLDGSVWLANGSTEYTEIGGNFLANGLTTTVEQNGGNLTFTDPYGNSSAGRFLSAMRVEATNWGGLTATIDADGNLNWIDGSVWLKADFPDLSGLFYANGQTTSVEQDGTELTFNDPSGNSSSGQFLGLGQVEASNWNLTATLDGSGNIYWSDGSVWQKAHSALLDGEFLAGGQPTSIERDGHSLIFSDIFGNTTSGRLLGPNQVEATGWGLTGTFDANGNLNWSDGSVWVKFDHDDYPDLSGNYAANDLSTRVEQSGLNLTFTDPYGNSSSGRFISATQVEATNWGGLTATIDADGNLNWIDGSVWMFVDLLPPSNPPLIRGDYQSNGLTTHIQQSGVDLVFIDENGDSIAGRFVSPTRLEATDWSGLRGTLTGYDIAWDDGTYWERINIPPDEISLFGVVTDFGESIDDGTVLTQRPSQLTFQFGSWQQVDPTSLEAITILRSGSDGVFGNGNDVIVQPTFLGIGADPSQVIAQFAGGLPDDVYRITVRGTGSNPIQTATGGPFNNGVDDVREFEVEFAQQVITVSPQPVERDGSGAQVIVHFKGDPVDPASANDPGLYSLTDTKTGDTYSPESLTFDAGSNAIILGFPDIGTGNYQLLVGTEDVATDRQYSPASDIDSSFATATDVGRLTTAELTIASQIQAQGATPPSFPGENGPTVFYNFQSIYGTDPRGNSLYNLISEQEKQHARDIFNIYAHYLGIDAVETSDQGITVASGDLRAVDPALSVGFGGNAGASIGGLDGLVVLDFAERLNNEFGGAWFDAALREIGEVLDNGGVNISAAQPILNGQITYEQLRRFSVNDVDLYEFNVPETGTVSLEIFAERIGSNLDSSLKLFNGAGEEIAVNDNSTGDDSLIQISLSRGNYFVAVTSSGTTFDPVDAESATGGNSLGNYDLRINFTPSVPGSFLTHVGGDVVDTDLNGTPGGYFEFQFNAKPSIAGTYYVNDQPASIQQTAGGLLRLVDETGATSDGTFVNNSQIIAYDFDSGAGQLDPNGILWSDGTFWGNEPNAKPAGGGGGGGGAGAGTGGSNSRGEGRSLKESRFGRIAGQHSNSNGQGGPGTAAGSTAGGGGNAFELIQVLTNFGENINEGQTNQFDTSPTELLFQFSAGSEIDANTLSAIQIVASGGDGTFDDGNETIITPGFIDIGDVPNEVIFRFAEALPQDQFQITVSGKGGPLLNFDGQDFTNVNPPDTVGDAGLHYYVQAVNHPEGSQVTIYNKGDGSVALGPFTMRSLAPAGSLGAQGAGDPMVLYDHLANRWVLAEFTDRFVGNSLNVYVSRTDDPTDNLWHYYEFATPEFPDYLKLGVWPDGYYVSTNESEPAVYVLDRTAMLAGLPAEPFQRFTAPPLAAFTFQALIPADLDGPEGPAGAPGYFMRHVDDEAHNPSSNDPNQDFLELWAFNTDFDTPTNSSFTQIANIGISEFDSDLNGYTAFDAFPQPGTNIQLDPLREVIMHRLQYRNFGTHEMILGVFVTDVDGTDHGGLRWFELRKSGGGQWALHQEGDVAPDDENRWMASISMDGDQNIAIGYNVGSETLSPSIRYTVQLAGDPAGSTRDERVIVEGAGFNSSNRWGDYNAMTIDPFDDSTFWFTGEYTNGTGNWDTRIAAFTAESFLFPEGLGELGGAVFNNREDDVRTFTLDLGAQVLAVDPQPVVRGSLIQNENQIIIHFNEDLDAVLAENAAFYQLINTQETLDHTDDVVTNPDTVVYDAVAGTATLEFAGGIPAGTYRLRVGTSIEPSVASTNVGGINDDDSAFAASNSLGTLGSTELVVRSQIEPQNIALPPLAGGNDEPGHRDIPVEEHIETANAPSTSEGADSVLPDEITTVYYNFQDVVGQDPDSGAAIFNEINEDQKQRTREIFEIFSYYLGIEAVETEDRGLIIATGDMRAVFPNVPTGPGQYEGVSEGRFDDGARVILDNAELWDDQYGGTWFRRAMNEIGHSLGLGDSFDLNSLQGPGLGNNEPVFGGDHDLLHLKRLFRPDATDIDLYDFELDETGFFTAEIFAERLEDPSMLNAALTLFKSPETTLEDDLDALPASVSFAVDSVANLNVRVGDTLRIDTEELLVTSVSGNAVSVTRGANGTVVATHARGATIVNVNRGNVVARNDDYYSIDSSIEMMLDPGRYFVGVTSTGNLSYNPNASDTGSGGTTDGEYDLRINFQRDPDLAAGEFLLDSTGTPIDGDGDGTPGGVFDFWFQATESATTDTVGNTLFVDKIAGSNPIAELGSLDNPFSQIDQALAAAAARNQDGNPANDIQIVRIIGNEGGDGDLGTPEDAIPYLIGAGQIDGEKFIVPQGITVMIDAGTLIKFDEAIIDVGSVNDLVSRRNAALQVLGTPGQQVFFTSNNNATLGGDTDGNPANGPAAGDWGGVVFRPDSDLEEVGVFLNIVNQANITFGGGGVFVESNDDVFSPIHVVDARPTISFNTITQSADSAISADPSSFGDQIRRGLVIALDNANIADGDTITLTDDIGVEVVFEFEAGGGVAPPNVAVAIGATDDDTIANLITQVNGLFGFRANLVQVEGTSRIELERVVEVDDSGSLGIELLDLFDRDATLNRIGLDVHGNTLIGNSLNGLFVRVATNPGDPIDVIDMTARFNDTDVTHIITESVQIVGSAGGPEIVGGGFAINLLGQPTNGESIVIRDDFARTNAFVFGADVTIGATLDATISNLVDAVNATADFNALLTHVPGTNRINIANIHALTVNSPVIEELDLGVMTSRESGRLRVDSGIVVKLAGARIEAERGHANFIAEADQGMEAIFTSVFDDRFGRGGTFDTNNDDSEGTERDPISGDWGGLILNAVSTGSIDNSRIEFGGGGTPIEGGFDNFNVIEVHQARFRLTNSRLEGNEALTSNGDRNGRGTNDATTILIRGTQPVITDNIFLNNVGSVASVNANSLISDVREDLGRSTGNIGLTVDPLTGELSFADNNGPLIRRNRYTNNAINGLEVRPEEITTETVWDDTDIVHVLRGEIIVPNFHTFGGVRLESTPSASLVVKTLGDDSGFRATGNGLDIDDRIGGTVQVIGQPLFPVVLTSLNDNSVGAGFRVDGLPQLDTANSGLTGTGGLLPTGPEVDNGTLIDNDVAQAVVGHFEADPQAGGEIGFGLAGGGSGVTAQGLTQLFTNFDFIFDFLNYVDVGSDGGAINLGGTTITQVPTLVSDDVVESTGTFVGQNGAINWTAQTRFEDGESRMINTITFDSVEPLGDLQFINYLDEDVLGVSDDILVLQGTPGQADFLAFTLDQAQQIGFAQGGIYQPGDGLQNATYDGFAADQFSELRDIIVGAGTTYSVPGNIDLTDLPQIGPNSFGPNDVTTAFSWTVDPSATTATVTTFLDLVAQPQNPAAPGDWEGLTLEAFSNDRNVRVVNETERAQLRGVDENAEPDDAQFLGQLAEAEKSADENRRAGFEIHGFIATDDPSDVDVYSFDAPVGTEVWFDIDRTDPALNTVLELINPSGTVLARSINNDVLESPFPAQLQAYTLTKDPLQGGDFYTSNPHDAGFRVILPGDPGEVNTFFVRVRSFSNDLDDLDAGVTHGEYQLQIRLRQADEHPGSTVTFSEINFSTNGVAILGLPSHSPLAGDTADRETSGGAANNTIGTAQNVGNLLVSDRAAIAIAGLLDVATDIDVYEFRIEYDDVHPFEDDPDFFDPPPTAAVTFDIDYADGLARADTLLNIYREDPVTGVISLVFTATESNVGDDLPAPAEGGDFDDISRGSAGKLDPYIGTVDLPEGDYFAVVSSNTQTPIVLDQFFNANTAHAATRLQPITSLVRVVNGNTVTETDELFINSFNPFNDQESSLVPFHLGDIVLYVSQDLGTNNTTVRTVDPFTGQVETTVGSINATGSIHDITLESEDGQPRLNLVGFTINPDNTPRSDGNTGHFIEIDTGTGSFTDVGDDGILTHISDGSTPPGAIRANANGPNGPGVGINFEAIVSTDGVAGLDGAVVDGYFAVGNRSDANQPPPGIARTTNILYWFTPNGVATSLPVPDRTGNGLISGAGTQIVERGELDTFLGSTVTLVDATIVDPTQPLASVLGTNFNIRDGASFVVDFGAGFETFELDAGIDTRLLIDPDSSRVQSVSAGSLTEGTTFEITTAFGVDTYEIDTANDGAAGAGNIAVAIAPGSDAEQVATQIAAAINGGATNNATATAFGDRIALSGTTLTFDAQTSGLDFAPPQIIGQGSFFLLDADVARSANGRPREIFQFDIGNVFEVEDGELIRDGDTITITDQVSGVPVTFEFDDDGSFGGGFVPVPFTSAQSSDVIIANLIGIANGLGFGLTLSQTPTTNRVSAFGASDVTETSADGVTVISNDGISPVIRFPSALSLGGDGTTFEVTTSAGTVTFEADFNNTFTPGNIPFPLIPGQQGPTVAQTIADTVNSIDRVGVQAIAAAAITDDEVFAVTTSNGTEFFEFDLNASSTQANVIALAGGESSVQVANAIAAAINATTGTLGATADVVGDRVLLNGPNPRYSTEGIHAEAEAALTDGNTFTITTDQGTDTYEIDIDGSGVTVGFAVNVTTGDSAADVAAAIVASINTNQTNGAVPTLLGDHVLLDGLNIDFNPGTTVLTENTVVRTVRFGATGAAQGDKLILSGAQIAFAPGAVSPVVNVTEITDVTFDPDGGGALPAIRVNLIPIAETDAADAISLSIDNSVTAALAAAPTSNTFTTTNIGNDGGRVNFLDASDFEASVFSTFDTMRSLMVHEDDFNGNLSMSTTGGFGTTVVQFEAGDDAVTIAAALEAVMPFPTGSLPAGVFIQRTGATIELNATVTGDSPPFIIDVDTGIEGLITGLATIDLDPEDGDGDRFMFAVSDQGFLYRVNNPNSSGSASITLIGEVGGPGMGIEFAGLATMPQRVEDVGLRGRYFGVLMGIDTNGRLYAFDTTGALFPAFVDGNTFIDTGLGNANGIEFSDFQENVWSIGGGGSFTTGGYNFAGGAHGSIESNRFSLEGYDEHDLPTLYFDYNVATQNGGGRDSLRAFISVDDGVWTSLATNNGPRQQPLFDSTGNRQVRIDLSPFVGLDNLKLRFDFSTAGDMNTGDASTVGFELRALPGFALRDGQQFDIDGTIFEFEQGITIVTPLGASIADGDTVSITFDNGGAVTRVFEFDNGGGIAGTSDFAVAFDATDTAEEVAQSLHDAIAANLVGFVNPIKADQQNFFDNPATPFVENSEMPELTNRINVIGATLVTSSNAFITRDLEGAFGTTVGTVPVVIDTSMERHDLGARNEPFTGSNVPNVRDVIRIALADTFAVGGNFGVIGELEPNDAAVPFAQAQDVRDREFWSLLQVGTIGDITNTNTSQDLPHISIDGSGDGTYDYYRFDVNGANPGNPLEAIFDIDLANFDSELFLYFEDGSLVATNDSSDTLGFNDPAFGTIAGTLGGTPADIDSGSPDFLDPLLQYNFTQDGTYILGVARSGATGDPGGIVPGFEQQFGDQYTLHMSIEDHPNLFTGAQSEIEPNNSINGAQNIDDPNNWTLFQDDDIDNAAGTDISTTIPHTTITGRGSNFNPSFDYFSFTVNGATSATPVRGVFDIDQAFNGFTNFDAEIFLYDSAGNLVADNDDGNLLGFSDISYGSITGTLAVVDDGSQSFADPFLQFDFIQDGTYVIGIAENPSQGDPGGIIGNTHEFFDTYTLHVSLEGHDSNFVGGAGGLVDAIKVYREVVRVIGHNVIDAGPLGLTDTMPGDNGGFNSITRGQSNQFAGATISNIIIGFAERGELVTGATGNQTNFTPNPASLATDIDVGEYQLEIRRTTESEGGAMDTNDRLAERVTLVAPEGIDIFEGQTFRLSNTFNDSTHNPTVTFEFVDLDNRANASPGNVPIFFNFTDSAPEVAVKMRDAINQPLVHEVLGMRAGISDSNATGLDTTSNLVNIYGNPTGDTDPELIIGIGGPGVITFDDLAEFLAAGGGPLVDADGLDVVVTQVGIDAFQVSSSTEFGDIGVIIYDNFGDTNLERRQEQGFINISGNVISNTLEYGIRVDADQRDAGSDLPHPGSVRNLLTINDEELVPGIVIQNNVVANFGIGGILFSGDANAGSVPNAAVPFGKLINNTVFGGLGPVGTGIQVDENASPTLLNNIVSNTEFAITIDGTSQSTVVGTTVFKNNGDDGTRAVNEQGSNAIQLSSTDPLFVDPSSGNFYLADDSLAIDSSLNRLADRPSIVGVKSPLGIKPSDIFAPDVDVFGQLRVDDPGQSPPPGLGFQVFKDRGAIERADFGGLTAQLTVPLDNNQQDLDPALGDVFLLSNFPTEFVISLIDEGIGVDDASVASGLFVLTLNGQPLVDGVDYQFIYNENTNEVSFVSTTGPFPLGTYEITIDNDDATDDGTLGIRDLAGNFIEPNRSNGETLFTIGLGPSITVTDVSVVEGDAGTVNATFALTLSHPPLVETTVDVSTADNSATTASGDYDELTQTVIWNIGDAGAALTKFVTVTVNGDTLGEPDETFFLNLTNAQNARIPDPQAVGTILNDDPPAISIDDVTIQEGSGFAPSLAMFTVSMTTPSLTPVTVDFATLDGTAIAGQDYLGLGGTLTFLPGDPLTQQINVEILTDIIPEADETFFVNLSKVSANAIIEDGVGIGTIVDGGPNVTITDMSGVQTSEFFENEGDIGAANFVVFYVTLSAPTNQIIAFDYFTSDGAATAGSDYTPRSGTLVYSPGGSLTQAVLVPILADQLQEGDEDFFLNLVIDPAAGDTLARGIIIDEVTDSGQPLHVAGPAGTFSDIEALQTSELMVIANAAVDQWESVVGHDPRFVALLDAATFLVADLPGTLLGMRDGSVVTIDVDAAGHGWFIDATPNHNEEFVLSTGGQLEATDALVDGRIDLLTVVLHELGHVVGLPDLDPNAAPYDLMAGTLGDGIRRLPSRSSLVNQAFEFKADDDSSTRESDDLVLPLFESTNSNLDPLIEEQESNDAPVEFTSETPLWSHRDEEDEDGTLDDLWSDSDAMNELLSAI